MRLDLCTWPEVEAYLGERTDIIVPIGSTEQHGPNGLIGTDALCAEAIGRAAGERAGALVAPTISIGMAQHHLGFPGSVSLRPSTLVALVRDVIASLARHGFTRIGFVNGHGGNVATVGAAFAEYYAETSFSAAPGNAAPAECRLRNWWELPAAVRLREELYGRAEGSHATPSEVAITQAVFPDHIKRADMRPEIAPGGSFADAADYRRRFPDGRIGSNPALATPEAGARLLETAAAELAEEHLQWIRRV
ncbi:MAG: creatininase family protein [Pseudomonadota bacterium]|nr:creatininase family protein [Pseudomonadota bacterium]